MWFADHDPLVFCAQNESPFTAERDIDTGARRSHCQRVGFSMFQFLASTRGGRRRLFSHYLPHRIATHAVAAVVALLTQALYFSVADAGAAQRPNIILILADDMAPGDFESANGGRSKTPNLERLAGQSVKFSQAYSASCVCAPARAALLTGRYPHRTGVVTLNMNRYPDLTRLRHDETTVAEVLQSDGYATGLIGKWHCGKGTAYGPRRHGFDEFEGFSGSQDLSYFKYVLQMNDRTIEVTDQYLTDDLSDRAIQFVRRHRDEPFFMHLAHYAPHRPLEGTG